MSFLIDELRAVSFYFGALHKKYASAPLVRCSADIDAHRLPIFSVFSVAVKLMFKNSYFFIPNDNEISRFTFV